MEYSIECLIKEYTVSESQIQKSEILLKIISSLRYRNEAELTRFYCEELLAIAHKLHSDYLYSRVYDAMSAMYFYIENYDRALDYAFLALEINERRMYNEQIAVNYHVIGLIYYLLEDYKNADIYFLQSIKNNPDFLNVNCNIARLYSDKKDFIKAEKYINKAISLIKNTDNSELFCFTYYNKAIIDERKNLLSEAQECLNLCYKSINKETDTYQYLNICNEQAIVHIKSREFEKALNVLKTAEDTATRTQRRAQLQKTWEIMSDLFCNKKDFAKACYYRRLSSDLKSQIFNRQISEKYLRLRTDFDSEIEQLKMLEIISHSAQTTSLGIVSAGIVHEINQPVSAIKVTNDSMLYWSKRNPGQIPDIILSQLSNISDSVSEINNLISQIKKFWKETDYKELAENIDVRIIFDKVLMLFSKKFHRNNISFDYECNFDLSFIAIFDKVLLEQIFLYILNMIADFFEIHKVFSKKFKIAFFEEIEFISICFDFDFLLNEMLFYDSEQQKPSSSTIDFRIAKYYLERYNGLLMTKNNDLNKTSTLKIFLPRQKESENG